MTEKSLADWAGLPIHWNEHQDEIRFDEHTAVLETKSRLRGHLRPVLPDDAACSPADAIQYWMYNGISQPEHLDAYARLGIQYELTLLYPTLLGNELSKTLGHIHTFPPNSHLNYAEVVEVVYGKAIFLFQTMESATKTAPFCYAVHAHQGDKVVFPPNNHHLTINAGDDMLLFSDLISVEARGNYAGLSGLGGAAYLYGTAGWSPNPNYSFVAPLKVVDAKNITAANWSLDEPLYRVIEQSPDSLRWLADPTLFGEFFPEMTRDLGQALNLF